MEIKIDKGIPVPQLTSGRRRIYPFHAMDVGDSFAVVVGADRNSGVVLRNVRQRAAVGLKGAICEARVEDGVDVIRCWRTK